MHMYIFRRGSSDSDSDSDDDDQKNHNHSVGGVRALLDKVSLVLLTNISSLLFFFLDPRKSHACVTLSFQGFPVSVHKHTRTRTCFEPFDSLFCFFSTQENSIFNDDLVSRLGCSHTHIHTHVFSF
jgi:hypothetical protein